MVRLVAEDPETFSGECATAAKQHGMRVAARMTTDLNLRDALGAHSKCATRYRASTPTLPLDRVLAAIYS
jgi:hypothetical protein